MNKSDLEKLIKTSKEPEGVTARSADGRLFFLTNEDAGRLAISTSKLYEAFKRMDPCTPVATFEKKGKKGIGANTVGEDCVAAWKWLETHDPNSARWRRVCLTYFEVCE